AVKFWQPLRFGWEYRKKLPARSPAAGKTFPMSWNTTALILSPDKGKGKGGVRSSRLFRKMASPPSGKPVCKSRGPAWFMPNPRRELLPPAKNLSGNAIKSVELNGSCTPTRVERAKTQRFL